MSYSDLDVQWLHMALSFRRKVLKWW